MSLEPPVAARRPVERLHHGDVVTDDYEWLRDKDDPEVLAHLHAENAYTDAQTADLAVLEELVYEEITRRTQEDDLSVPVREGRWWYYARTEAGAQYALHCRIPVVDESDWTPPTLPADGSAPAGEQIILDGNAEADGDFFSIGTLDVSPDGALLLWSVDAVGDERYELRIRDLATGVDREERIPGTSGDALWDASGEWIFYTTVDAAWRPDRVLRHRLGSASADDAVVLHEPDERFWVGVGLTRSRRYLVIELGSKITSEVHLIDATTPTAAPRVVWPRREGVEYDVVHAIIGGLDRLLVTHNEGAPDFRIDAVDPDDPEGARQEIVAHRAGVRVSGVSAFAHHLVLHYRRDTLRRVALARLEAETTTPRFHEIEVAEELFTLGAGGGPEWEQPTVRLTETSFITPAVVSELDLRTGERRELKRQPVLGGYDPAVYAQRRVWAEAPDGEQIPVSLVFRPDLVALGDDDLPATPAPLLLYGYGSYEHSIDPSFSIPRLSLLERGVVFAVAHVRGGGERGRRWYEQGRLEHKRNTFTDFVAAARHLVDRGWTSPERLVAEGGSAGGLLMGAVANLAPELFAGVLAAVPFVDPLTSILDPELPLTVVEWDEWGNPLADPEVYALMKSYSPYENVRAVRYPRILAVTSLNDTRVLYVEPAKWVARLREVQAPVLLRCEMSAGHGGVSGRYAGWRRRAFELAWILDAAGVHGR
ncbi:S9 family peptidase [Schumannella soli]|uniref:S9 family peptidase n=1 Tax=Schumannella soli TaxID=2590779 RepID=A0A506XTM4_9MICO|nr:S9 family peptidase [Schumannella soli]TPW76051.1 S9 family peptidase [Schumannella soli]